MYKYTRDKLCEGGQREKKGGKVGEHLIKVKVELGKKN